MMRITTTPDTLRHDGLKYWVEDMVELCEPDLVHWCDGSDEEYDLLTQGLVDAGTFTKLNDQLRLNWGAFVSKSQPPLSNRWRYPVRTGRSPLRPNVVRQRKVERTHRVSDRGPTSEQISAPRSNSITDPRPSRRPIGNRTLWADSRSVTPAAEG